MSKDLECTWHTQIVKIRYLQNAILLVHLLVHKKKALAELTAKALIFKSE